MKDDIKKIVITKKAIKQKVQEISLRFIWLSSFIVALAVCMPVESIFADSCPYCGWIYAEAAPGDEARVEALRRAHEASCARRSSSSGSSSYRLPSRPSPQGLEQHRRWNQADEAYKRGNEYYDKKDWDNAIKSYEESLKHWPTEVVLRNLRHAKREKANAKGIEYYNNRDWNNAIRYFREALEHAYHENVESNLREAEQQKKRQAEEEARRIRKQQLEESKTKVDKMLDNLIAELGTPSSSGSPGDLGKGLGTSVSTNDLISNFNSSTISGVATVQEPPVVDSEKIETRPLVTRSDVEGLKKPHKLKPYSPATPDKEQASSQKWQKLPSPTPPRFKEVPPPESPTAVIKFVKGTVERKTPDGWVPVEDLSRLRTGDEVRAGPDSSAEITFEDGKNKIILTPNSSYIFEGPAEKESKWEKFKGIFKGFFKGLLKKGKESEAVPP
ncbi:MAG: hypothetical protein ACE5KK_03990 [Candidatus Brocadiales bacterium]